MTNDIAPTERVAPRKSFFARHKVLTGFGIAIALILLISIVGAIARGGSPAAESPGNAPVAESPAEEAPVEEAPAGPGIGDPALIDAFEYTVLTADPAGTTVGTAPLDQTAQGQFFSVTVRVANVSNASETFIVNYLQLVDEQGRTFDADATATIYANPSADTWISAINPGNAVEGTVIFDLPADAVPVSLIAKGSLFSSGVTIALQ